MGIGRRAFAACDSAEAMMVSSSCTAPAIMVGAHAARVTAATNVLDHQADVAKLQEWLGYADIATMRSYDHRRTGPEGSPAFKVVRQGSLRSFVSGNSPPLPIALPGNSMIESRRKRGAKIWVYVMR